MTFINVVEQIQQLTDMEALDIAFISKFAPKKDVEKLINSLTDLFDDVIIDDLKLKMDVAVILCGMILKHISDVNEQIKLLEMVDMRQYIDIMIITNFFSFI